MNKDVISPLLDVQTTLNGVPVKVSELSTELQVDYLISHHFDVFRSKEATLWRLERLYYIMTKDGRRAPFVLNKSQKDFFLNYLLPGYKKIIILKSRQLGFTTLISLYFLDKVIFNPNSEALQIAHTLKDAGEIFNRKIIYALKNLYPCVKDILDFTQAKSNRQQFSYPDGSVSAIAVSNSGRSGTFSSGIHVSELAKLAKLYPGRAEEIITGTFPAIPITGQAIIESTAEGASGIFYELFMGSWKIRDTITVAMSKAHFKPTFYNWQNDLDEIKSSCSDGLITVDEMEECEINWKEYQAEFNLTPEEMNFYYLKWINANKDIDKLHQEYPTTPMEAFLSSGSPYFSSRKTAEMYDRCVDDYKRYSFINGKFEPDERGDLYVYTEPQQGKNYVVGGDVAEGLLNGDYSVACVLGYDKEIKALYQGHCEPDEYKEMVSALGYWYNTALLAVEFNKDGNWVNTALRNDNYPAMYIRTTVDDVTKEVTKSYGWLTNKKNRDFMLGEAKKHFNTTPHINCKPLLDEILTFVRDKRGKPQAASGKHDDCFVKGTMITTNKGQTPIETLKVGDMVLTRNGYKPIIGTRQRLKKVITNLGLTGTPDHPVITENGEKYLTDCHETDTLYIWNTLKQKIEKLSFTKALNITVIQTHKEDNLGFTSMHTQNGNNHLLRYIVKFGKIILDQFLKVFMSIIKTGTHSITALKIWLQSMARYTSANIYLLQNVENNLQKTEGKILKSFWMVEESGGLTQRIKSFNVSTELTRYMALLKQQIVYSVVKSLLIPVNLALNIAEMLVAVNGNERIVYNIQVEDNPEYFANNILVHNCVISWCIALGVLQGRTEVEQKKTEAPSIMRAIFGIN